ncbi:5-methyltetrahydropteroyltriglutamate--homocysteine S-methyltransferase [Marinoscillum sp. MHG1-6]|uniref:5-methyltetrahydropteroyltriglutamate-- homocysteine S-methyltransferase n=1 Tax=Marinoscillum sp. MHG1-6 TaxID=2959627 RepID=UPI00215804D2|nr:5-methyltetrahydropteroyltriglutamate--homocysteine S-methyltransferase [Marinoscillum sp. MHG1-6]
MQTHNLGYPRIGSQRELKFACEQYWSGKIDVTVLQKVASDIRKRNWRLQSEADLDLIPSNDFSYYDQVLDMSLVLGAIPKRYEVLTGQKEQLLDLYFAMARGVQKEDLDLTAMEMTKWFDTNYHYIVPEFTADQTFEFFDDKPVREFKEALELGYSTKPVLIGPLTYLLLGKEKEDGFDKLDLIDRLLPVYLELIGNLVEAGAEWIQLDEPFLAMDLETRAVELYQRVYQEIRVQYPDLKILMTTYFEGLRENLSLALSLPICALHIDLVRDPSQLDDILDNVKSPMSISLGVVDGRNVWINNYDNSLKLIGKAIEKLGEDRVMIAPSCSLLHVPCDLQLEYDAALPPTIKQWLSFARQKLGEIKELAVLAELDSNRKEDPTYIENQRRIEARKRSELIHDENVKARVSALRPENFSRMSGFGTRQQIQKSRLNLPLFPTTTIGSFPQTVDIRQLRLKHRRAEITNDQYELELQTATKKAIQLQEAIGLDVLVHGEFERNDMVEYFGQQLDGFVFTRFGWVQSYGSRCVKPPIIFGDVKRPKPMTVKWSAYAQSLTEKVVKGMLTGPVTILQWSFVRDDQPRKDTCNQIALAIADEVKDLESAGISAIQVDEPAIREGLPLRRGDWSDYLDWAVRAFRLSTSNVKDKTQIHTHMCYSEFNDIIEHIAAMDADVITIECSRSQMELLDAFGKFNYPNEIGPGVYDIHSPRVPTREEMVDLMEKAVRVIPADRLWVNPDCGLKTRNWPETIKALEAMVDAAQTLRQSVSELVD